MSRQEGAGWEVTWDPEDLVSEVLPIDDLIFHMDRDECVCKPRVERLETGDGRPGLMISHNSLDGREVHTHKLLVVSIPLDLLKQGAAVVGALGLAWWLSAPWRAR